MNSKSSTADLESQIGERIRLRRIRAGVSQENLGKRLGITFQQIQKYEKGTNRVSAGRLLKIAEALECEVMDFFEGLRPNRTKAAEEFSKFLATKEGIEIVEAMSRIKNQGLRRTVIEIAERRFRRIHKSPVATAPLRRE
jgi:transcriptional regulator with XRE-family HTH domain